MALASRLASSAGRRRRWKAIRWADFGPIPGRRPSSSTRFWTGPSYTLMVHVRPLLAEEAAEAAGEAAEGVGDAAETLGLQFLSLAETLVHRGHDEVLQHLHVVGIDRPGVDRDRLERPGPGHHGLDDPAAHRGLHGLGRQPLLRGHHVGLHLLNLLHHLVHLVLAGHNGHSLTVSLSMLAPKVSMTRPTGESTPRPSPGGSGGRAISATVSAAPAPGPGAAGGSGGVGSADGETTASSRTTLSRTRRPSNSERAPVTVAASPVIVGRCTFSNRDGRPSTTMSPSTRTGWASLAIAFSRGRNPSSALIQAAPASSRVRGPSPPVPGGSPSGAGAGAGAGGATDVAGAGGGLGAEARAGAGGRAAGGDPLLRSAPSAACGPFRPGGSTAAGWAAGAGPGWTDGAGPGCVAGAAPEPPVRSSSIARSRRASRSARASRLETSRRARRTSVTSRTSRGSGARRISIAASPRVSSARTTAAAPRVSPWAASAARSSSGVSRRTRPGDDRTRNTSRRWRRRSSARVRASTPAPSSPSSRSSSPPTSPAARASTIAPRADVAVPPNSAAICSGRSCPSPWASA